MRSLVTRLTTAAVALTVTSTPLLAQSLGDVLFWWLPRPRPTPTPVSVPEIDASTGLLAAAAVLAALLFTWERRRRAR
ncbi:VPEID-CTERM sorting domain-containing protein [Ruixingdingia sedimenti]|uniref:VPEID-CTERM sorting domain-containing protein n=1 Tax=Ruixingdingia sedimenti TaxID=3073604 RepID=A0ABU1FCR0_9RHOB|nr:VPEID-CTERM sorting domain-containing protein [Xinfangfangia sp. LG-4]MDR5654655.1 VPEID-CTERM sorting domain-containing protein [Xinfangfangia sp. LG-4]